MKKKQEVNETRILIMFFITLFLGLAVGFIIGFNTETNDCVGCGLQAEKMIDWESSTKEIMKTYGCTIGVYLDKDLRKFYCYQYYDCIKGREGCRSREVYIN